ncbi:MAG: GNAT family N-acetyltransferase [Bacteroidales bacterium]|nr:GNAT family N-acetyltransferase [Bacteroidales bacterium]
MAGTDPWITLQITVGQIEETLRDPIYESWVALAGEEIAGVAVIQMKGACTGYLKSIAVSDQWRKKHVGSQIMDFIEQRIFAGHSNVFLCVSSFNEVAKQFYVRRGYREIGVIRNYLAEGYDEIFMRKTTGPVFRN